jgi:4-amino-4-deoxy-L-arabinose transferase-like glycosyltransferase
MNSIFMRWGIPVLLLAILSYITLFNQLHRLPMNLWDESSYALNALEMLETGNLMVVQQFGEPDLYNTKPPFAIWCMALSIHFFGFNELGVRLPAALFAFFTICTLFIVFYRLTKNGWMALIPAMILMGSEGYVGMHIARTGDTDVVVAYWILLQCVCFFQYILSKKNYWLLATAVAVSLGCLTKGIGGLVALPGLFVWMVFNKELKNIMVSKAFYVGILFFCVSVIGYYVWRNMINPGYIDAVWNFEIGGRLWQQEYLNPEIKPFYWYYQEFITSKRLATWIFILPLAIALIIIKRNETQYSTFILYPLAAVSIALGISSTKLFWYDAALYPLIAWTIGQATMVILQAFSWQKWWALAVVCAWPIFVVANKNITEEPYTNLPKFLLKLRNTDYPDDTLKIINADFNFALVFYQTQHRQRNSILIEKHPHDTTLRENDLLVTFKYAREVDLNQRFIMDTLANMKECNLYRIKRIIIPTNDTSAAANQAIQ